MPAPLPPVVILCGGLGTRLRPVVSDRPKVLADVAGRPFLAHLLAHLASQGAREVVLSAGHMADQIEAFAASGAPEEAAVRVVTESQPLGTAGALRYAADTAGLRGTFLALNGDTYFSGSLRQLLDRFDALECPVTLALVHAAEAGRYGSVQFDAATGAVTAFREKGSTGPGWINAGAYALSVDVLDDVPAEGRTSLEKDVLPAFIGRGLAAVAFPDALFLDIGTPADYSRAAALFQNPPTT